MSFDAFGSRRKTNWIGALSQQETEDLLAQIGIGTSRGFTGHEHLDRTGLIHMNGRVYDPTLGRFLSADPYVQAPYFSQSYNRYTYTFNNPLIFNDPSGYLADENVNESSKETEDRKEKEKPEKPKPEPQKKTPEKEAKEKAKDEAKKEETGDEEKADDKNECYDSPFCYHIAGDDLSKPGSSEKKEGEDTSKKKKGNVDGKEGDGGKEDQAVIDGLNRAIKIIDRAETISDVLTIGGIVVDIATVPSGEAVVIGAAAKASANVAIKKAFKNQLKQHGLKSLQRSHRKITRRLNEHVKKLDEIKAAGGKTSSVEREIRTFQRQIKVLDDIFKGV